MNERAPFLSDGETPADTRARTALRAALALLVPLARWLVRNGVGYASFAPALKTVFVEAARRELATPDGAPPTDSALSVLSGVHRRDIRAMGSEASPSAAQPKAPSVASQLFTRWLTDPALRGPDDRPRPLPKSGESGSFDALARQVSSDVHPRTLLDEMQRLGLVAVDGDTVQLHAAAFVPQEGFDEMAALLSANVSDHLAAAVHNLHAPAGPKFLEQSLFGSGLSPASAERLGESARRAWQEAFRQMAAEAAALLEQDAKDHATSMRMRFGVYFYAEPKEAPAPAAARPARTRGQTPSQHGSTR